MITYSSTLDTDMTLGTKLILLRRKKKISQKEVADYLEINQSTYSQWESDLRTCKAEFIPLLARFFEVDISEFFTVAEIARVRNEVNNEFLSSNELIVRLLESKDEVIRLLKEDNERLRLLP